MYRYLPITDVYAREILDSRGNPTIEVEVLAGEEFCGRAGVPSGASTGRFEAVELRDREKRYRGMGVRLAAEHVNARIAPEIIGMNVFDQAALDGVLVRLDRDAGQIQSGSQRHAGSIHGGCQVRIGGPCHASLFLSGRNQCKEASGAYDERD